MSEEERREFVRSAAEAHAELSVIATRLRHRLARKAPALIAAVNAERESFRLMRELQGLDLAEAGLARLREARAKLRRRRRVIDPDRLRS